jgi:superfamily II DNA or RNA helicase
MLRLFLPPNLAATAPRDAIAVRVEVDSSVAPPAEMLPALALLQRWCATPMPPKFIQLTRRQLRDLLATLPGQPVFFWVNSEARPIAWQGDILPGVSEHLAADPVPAGAPPATAPARSPAKPASSRQEKSNGAGRLADADASPMRVDGTEHYLAITLPSREHPTYAAALELVKSHGFSLEPSNRKWWLRDRHKALNFLATQSDRLHGMFGADFTPNFEKSTAHLRPAKITADVAEAGSEFTVTLGLQAGGADSAELRSAIAGNRHYLETDGKIFLIDPDQLERLAQAQRTLAGDFGGNPAAPRTHRLKAASLAEAEDVLAELAPGFQPPAAWKARSEALRNLSALVPAPVPTALDGQLRSYQRIGVAWLWHLWRHELGGVLADEMGLGKTLQALGLLSAIHQDTAGAATSRPPTNATGRSRPPPPLSPAPGLQSPANPRLPSLVVCPASLLENWRREAARFAPDLRPFVHHGSQRLARGEAFAGFNLIVTSYGTLARDRELFAAVDFACVVADEAQHIKNRRSQNAAALRSLRARARFLLTGTPLENSLDDLRSLFEFLLPGYLERVPEGTRANERGWFDERLRAKTAPYILRRTKQFVAPELPEKIEQILWCELGPAQAALYRAVQEKTERELLDLEAGGASEAKLRFAALTQLLRLRQICCDPRLVSKEATRSTSAASAESNPQSASRNPQSSLPDSESAKLEAFQELLAEAIDDGHRVLVFSQFTSLLALLRAELTTQEIPHCYLDGSMPPKARQAEVDRFQSSADIPVFLLSLKAGGTGLNLTAADTVVHFDPWWNPAVEAQATDRAHRIGQTRAVTSYKLIASGTVEEKVLALQDTKRALLADVFEASDAAAAKITLADLKALLR